MLKRTFAIPAVYLLLLIIPVCALAQPTWTFEPFGKEKKPEQYENKKLGSEKTADKKFTVPRNFIQNTVTHYNYYFNANNRVNAIIERAKMSNKEEYANLLSFYPYSLENTKTQTTELDSVVITSTAGILLHDLRNDWIDNMYLLIGKAYFLRKDFDSAAMTFQFINYNLFPRKRRNDDDDRIVGTNSAAGANNVISIANKEKRNIIQKVVSLPPSRNDALIWLARTFIEQEEYADAAGLINTLQNDPNLPKRLRNDLEEVNAYWFFRQGSYDSAAVHLEKALTAADTKQDKSRWEYLLGQMYEMNGQYDKASKYYSKASKHTVDPLLDIYAQLNEAKMMKGGNVKELDKSISNLNRMGRKDRFDAYRDIVYYAAGQLALKKPDTAVAINLYRKSIKYNEGNVPYKNRAFLQLGDIAYSRKQYRLAAAMYDSVQGGENDSSLSARIKLMQERKAALGRIVEATTNIEREDSLQRLAGMEAGARDEFIKKLLKKLRKEKGVKDDGSYAGGEMQPFGNNTQAADLFGGNTKGEWYFYNSSLKSRGFNEFKSKWGNRSNVDNWRRRAAAENIAAPVSGTGRGEGKVPGDLKNAGTVPVTNGDTELSYDAMIKNVPLTEEKMNASNDILASNLLELAKAYQNDLEEYQMAADTYEDYLRRFPTRLADGEVYLGLYFCYSKLGNSAKADYYKGLLNSKFASSPSAQKLNNPGVNDPKVKNPAATQLYERIYGLFIEGNFEQAMAEKKKADNLYGVNYWTPQLVYIEALQHVKNRNDSMAISTLQTLMTTYPTSPLSEKAATMIDVVKRRSEIEKYLTELQVTRAADDPTIVVPEDPKPVVKAPVAKPLTDTTKKVTPPAAPSIPGSFALNAAAPHYVVMVLDKVDGVYVNEARNAFNRYNREKYYGQTIDIVRDAIDAEHSILLISPFANADEALVYYDKIRRSAAREVSWLPANKYSFLIINNDNLQLLKSNKNIQAYKTLLNTQYPNRF